jgi:hypothetical protein
MRFVYFLHVLHQTTWSSGYHPLLCIREVPGSNIGPETGYLHGCVMTFLYLQVNVGIMHYFKPQPLLSNISFTSHNFIQRYILSVTEKLCKINYKNMSFIFLIVEVLVLRCKMTVLLLNIPISYKNFLVCPKLMIIKFPSTEYVQGGVCSVLCILYINMQ